jgi:hypothetical protein
VRGFCESCGRYPRLPERIRGGGLARNKDGLFVCPACQDLPRTPHAPLGTVRGSGRRRPALIAAGIIAIVAFAGVQLTASMFATPGDGGVQGVARRGPSMPTSQAFPSVPDHSTHVSSPGASAATTSSAPPSSDIPSPVATNEPAQTQVQPKLELSVGEAAVRTWNGPYGETRLQVIVPVRNDDARWLTLPRSSSTYRIIDQERREVARGVFTASLPASIGPGDTGYLVDTVSVTFVDPSGAQSVVADVHAILADPPVASVSVSELSATTGRGGGLRVTGQVRNEGSTTTGWIMAGAVALAQDGTPMGAVYDPTDIGLLEPGEVTTFDTEYPGAPPPQTGVIDALVGVAFEAAP